MELKKIIIVLGVTILVMVGVFFGVSYGWYAYQTAESNISGSTITVAPSIIFSQTEYITSTQNMPLLDEDRYNYANKNSFTITIGNELKDYETGIQIDLKNIFMSNELKITNYKYELLQNNVIISGGDFSNIGNQTTLSLMPMTIMNPISYPSTYIYDLYIWLSDDGSNQNELMNKTFSAKVSINSAVKK